MTRDEHSSPLPDGSLPDGWHVAGRPDDPLPLGGRDPAAIWTALRGKRLAVVGDLMLDAYWHGDLERVSPEAPVPVFELGREETRLGGAANVANCLTALGADVALCGVVGDDEAGRSLRDRCRAQQIDPRGVLVDPSRPTTRKTRLVARHQQIIRLDRESRQTLSESLEARLVEAVREAAGDVDAFVLSDYAKGALTSAVARAVIESAAGRPVIVDPKQLPWDRFRGATAIKPNRDEAARFLGAPIRDDRAALAAGERMLRQLGVAHALITRGPDGISLVSSVDGDLRHWHFRARPLDLIDVTGAGDVASAVLALALAAELPIDAATWLANVAAGIKVAKFGAETVSLPELQLACDARPALAPRRILRRDQAAAWARDQHRAGQRVVFTNGCFDLIHAGHVEYLEQSRRLGDVLIVGLNSDASVRRLKGSSRPLQAEADRARILSALTMVDAVVIFDEDTPLELILAVRPDVLTKGGDYRLEQVVGAREVEAWGGRVQLIDLVPGRSTTSLLRRAA